MTRVSRGAELRAALAAADSTSLGQVTADEQEVTSWLARLRTFSGMPFNYLVPDPAALPPESIRFFKVDENWVEALIDGAFSIGGAPTLDAATEAVRPRISAAAKRRAGAQRRLAFGGEADADPPQMLSGFLLRSVLVSAWPGLQVQGYADPAGTQLLGIVRFERIAPSIALCLFAGVVACLELQEPSEALHLGIAMPAPDAELVLRSLDTDNLGAHAKSTIGVSLRAAPDEGRDQTVVQIDALATNLGKVVLQPAGTLTAAEFGLELTQSSQQVQLKEATT